MGEKLSKNHIPTRPRPNAFELARGRAYVDTLKVAVTAKTMPDGEQVYKVAKDKIERLGFSGVIFDQVVDYRIKLDAQRGQNGKRS